jgi:hypothetical protein
MVNGIASMDADEYPMASPDFVLLFHPGTIPKLFETVRDFSRVYNIIHLNVILQLYFIETP